MSEVIAICACFRQRAMCHCGGMIDAARVLKGAMEAHEYERTIYIIRDMGRTKDKHGWARVPRGNRLQTRDTIAS